MPNHTPDIEKNLENFETVSDFYDDTEAMIIKRFYVLNKKLNEENKKNVRDQLQSDFGSFLINIGNTYLDFLKNNDKK